MCHPSARRFQFLLLIFFSLPMFVLAQTPNKFPIKKQDMPLNGSAVERPIDHDCGPEGTVSGDAAQKAQNRAKNDFGEHGTPVAIKITDFDLLEQATERAKKCAANHLTNCQKLVMKKVGDQSLPSDRTQLKNIAKTAAGAPVGEGTLVVLEAKVLHSKYSNSKFDIHVNNGKSERSQGESVNCKGVPDLTASSEIDRNDIHVVLAAPGVTKECLSVTAEISPHFRPESWRHFHNQLPNQAGEDVNDVVKGVKFTQFQAVRITGPLFYDASHTPCTPGHSASPPRRSIWEIHPVYKLEVKTSSGPWISFEKFMTTH